MARTDEWRLRVGTSNLWGCDGARQLSLASWYPTGLVRIASNLAEERWDHSACVTTSC